MKRQILKNIIALVALFIPYIASAQCYEIYKDGVKITYNFNEVDSITFINDERIEEPIEGKYVDLGLSVKWAKMNIGAKSDTDAGSYFSWAELETKNLFDPDKCTTLDLDIKDISGNVKYDAATYNLGDHWRMPTIAELEELANECSWEWTTIDGRAGAIVTGPNGNSIFMPAAGYRYGSDVFEDHYRGYYWSSNLDNISVALCLKFNDGAMPERQQLFVESGLTIRPVLVEE